MRLRAALLLLLMIGASAAWGADSALIQAARSGNTEKALRLIEEGADVNALSANGTTALHWAAHFGETELAQRLIDAGARPDVVNEFGATPLSEAALIGSAPIIRALVEAGADPNESVREGQTPLMVVARTGKIDAARVLLDHGAEVDAREGWGGQTALMWAAAQSQPDMVKLLIEHGADVNARSKVRNWSRHMTAEPRKKDLNEGGFTPLLYTARNGCIACAKHLVDAGADLDKTDPDRVTPLNLAIQNRNYDLAKYFIEAGADVNKWDFFGRTPLYHAIDMHIMPEIPNQPDLPALDDTQAFDLVKILLQEGANPNIQLKHRPQYRQAIFQRGRDIMLSTGATPLLLAARAAKTEVMKLLLDHGALAELPNQYGVTPFMAAAGVGFGVRASRGADTTGEERIAAMKILLDAGAAINRRTLSQGRTPPDGLDNFLWRVRIQVNNQRYLFSNVPPDGRIAMHGAARNGWNKVVRFLAENGAEIAVAGRDDKTPLDLAAGRYRTPFLVTEADPYEETMALLEKLCDERPGCSFPEPDQDSEPAETAQNL